MKKQTQNIISIAAVFVLSIILGAHTSKALSYIDVFSSSLALKNSPIHNVQGRVLGVTTAPVINVVVNNITKSGARIIFYVSQPAVSAKILYGTTAAYGSTFDVVGGNVSKFSWYLSGLAPNTLYHFCPQVTVGGVQSTCDGNQNDFTFTTTGETSTEPEMPRSYVDTTMPSVNGQTFNVNSDCSNLQQQINAAAAADGSKTHQVVIPAGAVCDGVYKPPVKSAGSGWIIVRTSTPDSQLPAPGTRVNPSHKSLLATIRNNQFGPVSSAPANRSWSLPCKQGQTWWGYATGIGFNLASCSPSGTSWVDVPYIEGAGAPPAGTCTVGQWYWNNLTNIADAEIRNTGAWLCVAENGTTKFANMNMTNSGGIGDMAALQLAAGANRYRFVGIEFTTVPTANDLYKMLVSTVKTNDRIIFDRSYFHGHPSPSRLYFAIELNGSNVAVIDSYIDEVHYWTTHDSVDLESFAIYITSGPGPVKVVNNFISAIGISMYAPDDTGTLTDNVADVEVRGNYFYKDIAKYRDGAAGSDGRYYFNRHSLELKRGVRWLVDGNIFDGNFASLQQGSHIALTPREGFGNYQDDNNIQISDIIFTNNIFKNAPNAITVTGHQTAAVTQMTKITQRIKISNNLFEKINGSLTTARGLFGGGLAQGIIFQIYYGPEDVEISHNTIYGQSGSSGAIANFDSGTGAGANLKLNNNLMTFEGGIGDSGAGYGTFALNRAWTKGSGQGWDFAGNVLIGPFPQAGGNITSAYPSGNFWPVSNSAVGFTNSAASNFQLTSSSAYKNLATDGADPGVNWSALASATAYAQNGGGTVYIPTSPPPPPIDSTAPTISSIVSSAITASSTTISWTTNEASDTQVEYGLTTSYGSASTLYSSPVTSHSVSLSGLTAGTLYHYRVKSKDAAGNLATSIDQTFTTVSAASVTASITTNTASVNFGTIPVGSSTGVSTISVSNTSTAAILASGLTMAITGDFKIVTNYCTFGLVPNSHCEIYVAFTPTTSGTRTGSVVFTAPGVLGSPKTVQLTGTGSADGTIVPPTPTPAPPPLTTPTPQTPPPTTTPTPQPSPITTYSGNVVPLRLINQSGTYYVVQNNQKLGVTNPGMLFSYGLEFKDAVTPTAAEIALPQGPILLPGEGALVKSPENPTVYLISNGKKHGFSSEAAFNGLGFKFGLVLVVTSPELNSMPLGEVISDIAKPHLPGTDINVNGTIYYIGSDSKRYGYPSQEVWNSWHFDNDFSNVVTANSADLLLQIGDVVPLRKIE